MLRNGLDLNYSPLKELYHKIKCNKQGQMALRRLTFSGNCLCIRLAQRATSQRVNGPARRPASPATPLRRSKGHVRANRWKHNQIALITLQQLLRHKA